MIFRNCCDPNSSSRDRRLRHWCRRNFFLQLPDSFRSFNISWQPPIRTIQREGQ